MAHRFNYLDDGTCQIHSAVFDDYGVLARYTLSPADVLNLCGGVPSPELTATKLTIRSVSPSAVDASVVNDLYTVQRTLDFDLRILSNTVMYLNDRGKGIGLALFLNQVKKAREMGFTELTLYAAGLPGQTEWTGYHFWGRVGFQMTDRNDIQDTSEIISRFAPGLTFSEFMLNDEGYAFWKENGIEWTGKFLLEEGSESMRHLQRYLEMKGIDFPL